VSKRYASASLAVSDMFYTISDNMALSVFVLSTEFFFTIFSLGVTCYYYYCYYGYCCYCGIATAFMGFLLGEMSLEGFSPCPILGSVF